MVANTLSSYFIFRNTGIYYTIVNNFMISLLCGILYVYSCYNRRGYPMKLLQINRISRFLQYDFALKTRAFSQTDRTSLSVDAQLNPHKITYYCEKEILISIRRCKKKGVQAIATASEDKAPIPNTLCSYAIQMEI